MKKKDEYWDRVQKQLKKEWYDDHNFCCLSESEIQIIIDEYIDTDLNEFIFE